MVQLLIREKNFTETFLHPLSTMLLARAKFGQNTEEEKKAIAKSLTLIYQGEVPLIMRYRVAKRGRHSLENVDQALIHLETFIQEVKYKKIEDNV